MLTPSLQQLPHHHRTWPRPEVVLPSTMTLTSGAQTGSTERRCRHQVSEGLHCCSKQEADHRQPGAITAQVSGSPAVLHCVLSWAEPVGAMAQ